MKAKQLRALREYVMELEHECLVLTGLLQGGAHSDERSRQVFDASVTLSRKILDRPPLDQMADQPSSAVQR